MGDKEILLASFLHEHRHLIVILLRVDISCNHGAPEEVLSSQVCGPQPRCGTSSERARRVRDRKGH